MIYGERFGAILFKLTGGTGNAKQGLIFFRRIEGSKWAGIECKKRSGPRYLGKTEIKECVEKALLFEPPLSLLIIATTGPRDARIQEYIRCTNDTHEKSGLFTVQMCFWDDIEKLIQKHFPEWGLPEIRIKNITSPIDPDLEGFRELYQANFGEDTDANPFRDLVWWIKEYEIEENERRSNPGIDHPWRGYVVVAKVGFKVVGFLHADGHKPTGYLFVNWIAMDGNNDAVKNGRGMGVLLGNAIEMVSQDVTHPKMVIAEFMANSKLAALIRWNDGQADRWGSKLAGQQTQAYILPMKYIQPHLRIPTPEDVRKEMDGVLAYIPLEPPREIVERNEVATLVDIVYNVWYQSTYDDNYSSNTSQSVAYQKYLQTVYKRMMGRYDRVRKNSKPWLEWLQHLRVRLREKESTWKSD